ncbi:TetR/AcrR family transcriptional regulator [Nonomuraea muscovyensis]|uniref:AcrR family transcriptional regulator n=1 Tax=Nonomuraea muscovyensis TaxID=1124761 RepID=A0A7X0C4C8_9ACTN|nr:TetR/AcrR family transcriptional regulator [Nonomuraea muscovyensis]MBB6347431.1 AcrR family transcriptional regulator [Nonomuraea muscovyensis]
MPAKPPAVPSVWARPRKEREQPALSRERIVAEAVRLLDAEGIDALSMRSLGTRLGAGATSLYRHVASKDELIELAVDEVFGELEVPEAAGPGGWRPALTACGQSLRSMVLRHPWFASVVGQVGLAYLGPNMMRMSDRVLGILGAAGLGVAEADRAVKALVAYVLGMATSEAAWLNLLAQSGQDEGELLRSLMPAAEQAVQDYPHLRAFYSAAPAKDSAQDPAEGRDEDFDYGLQCLLDGFQTRLG